ncbi:transcription factor IIIA-like isoform X2 [Daphnia pulex]|uniref:transcription factor IIIA-like isoform X2 n=1 Tax=Daphnia pulex TaxID=6669 RepID=UPI001EE0CE13|nr:transcription factor IIIA-like isoform X2 [Daphnia pulex]XP_046453053.1 transcription factor IIIA-like isoform X2 [Daphnia pulex]
MDSGEEFSEDVDIDDKSTDKGNKKSVKKRYKCTHEDCSAAFGKPSRLVQHERIHSGERPFKCEQCEQSYTRSFHLKRHVSTVHEQLAVEMFLCPKENCGKQFVSRQKMKVHHENAHSANSLKCPTCEKTFKKNQQLKIHQYQHTGILPYVCDYEGCGKRFLMPSRLKGHAKIHKGYLCTAEGCNQEFPMWSALRKHKAEAHAQKHVCTVCNSSFKTRGFLKSHMKMHQPTREVFHCTIESCSRQFYYQKNLQSHIDNYHNPGQFQCKEEGCGKIFIQKASLKSHVARHRLPASGEKIRNAPTNRKVRSDKGQPKKAIAAILSGQPVTNSESKIIMRSLE